MLKKNCLTLCFLLNLVILPILANEPVQPSLKKGIIPISKQIQSTIKEKNTTNLFNSPENQLGLKWAEDSILKADELIKNKKFNEAKAIIFSLDSWLSDTTEMHTSLFKTLRALDTAKLQADFERSLALNFATLRDQNKYQIGIIYKEEKQYQKAAKVLTDIVKSQPKTSLGMKAYEALEEIGFTQKVPLSKEEKTTEEIKPF